MIKYQEGDKVKVIANIGNHGFKIGHVVTIVDTPHVFDDWHLCAQDNGEWYILSDEEIELHQSLNEEA